MRHKKAGKRLGRTWEHRKAMFRNMARSLLTYGRIRTTETKAKELRKIMDRLVTLALRNDLHARRQAYKVLENHALVKKLFDEVGPLFEGVPGGFTRVVKLGEPRKGDNATLAIIEFSRSAEDAAPKGKKKKAAAKTPAAPKAAPAEEAATEAPAEEAAAEEVPEAPAEAADKAPEDAPEDAPEEAPAEQPEEAAEEAPAEADEADAEKKAD